MVLIKGQSVAQCYERPLWRASGDVDLLFDRKEYRKAAETFLLIASNRKRDERYSCHLGLTVVSWFIKTHGTLRMELSAYVDKTIDDVPKDTFENNRVRVWHNGETEV